MRSLLTAVTFLLIGIALGGWLFAPGIDSASAQLLVPQVPKSKKKSVDLNIVDDGVYRVRSVVDGDTVVLENGLHLRYNGMNAPESGRWVRDPSPMSKEATAKNIELVEGKRVRIKLAPDMIDMHGRIVANLFIVPDDPAKNEIEVREVMLKGGFAKVMGMGITAEENKILKSWQDEAKAAEAGIWGIKKEPKESIAIEDARPFCASSNSKIFHRATCSQARRITPANLHEYATQEIAEEAGLKPCAQCLGKR